MFKTPTSLRPAFDYEHRLIPRDRGCASLYTSTSKSHAAVYFSNSGMTNKTNELEPTKRKYAVTNIPQKANSCSTWCLVSHFAQHDDNCFILFCSVKNLDLLLLQVGILFTVNISRVTSQLPAACNSCKCWFTNNISNLMCSYFNDLPKTRTASSAVTLAISTKHKAKQTCRNTAFLLYYVLYMVRNATPYYLSFVSLPPQTFARPPCIYYQVQGMSKFQNKRGPARPSNSVTIDISLLGYVENTTCLNTENPDLYKVVQIWPGQTVTCLHTISPGHIWTTLYFDSQTTIREGPILFS